MADIALEPVEDLEFPDDTHATSTGISNTKMAMWVYLASDCLLFGGLISTYLLYKNRPGSIPGLAGSPLKASELFNIPFTSMTSFILLMSSLTMVLAVNAAKEGDDRNTRVWLSATALLGALFVGGQVYEFTAFYQEGLGFTTSLFGSSFFTLTGFHGVHVSLGIIMLMALVGIITRSKVPGDKAEVVELIGLYWHFVDVVGRDLRDRVPDPVTRSDTDPERPLPETQEPA